MSQPFTLYNTLTQTNEPFEPLEPGKVKMYVCGPTVYDQAHLGHARCYITWDVAFRFLKFLGYEVNYVRNVTDVDDKILQRAKDLGDTPEGVAEKNYRLFKEDMQALNVLDPTHEPRATQFIQEMIDGISALVDNGSAYPTPDGTVYYRTGSFKHYGELSKKPLDDLLAGARVDVDPNKESPTDFALWKGVADTETTAWKTPWGLGRPGWHMECSAMSRSLLGEQLDIHAGGADLIFPHHENEIAQSEAWTGKRPFVRYWLHNGFVNVSGEKMSKSLGNFSTIRKLLERYDANTIRYFLLTHHYRMPVDFNDEALQGAENRMVKIHRSFRQAMADLALDAAQLESLATKPEGVEEKDDPIQVLFRQFTQAMLEDLNTPQAMAVMNDLIGEINRFNNYASQFSDPNAPVELSDIGVKGQAYSYPSAIVAYRRVVSNSLAMFYHLGFDLSLLAEQQDLPGEALQSIYQELAGDSLSPDLSPAETLSAIIELRKAAKAAKNWPQADAVRKHLTDIGITLKDNKDGTTSWELAARHDRQPVS